MLENLLPGSKGHSLSLANSAGVFPVRTQLELRSIIGILERPKNRNQKKMNPFFKKMKANILLLTVTSQTLLRGKHTG